MNDESLKRGIADAATGRLVDRGSFAQYADELTAELAALRERVGPLIDAAREAVAYLEDEPRDQSMADRLGAALAVWDHHKETP